MHKKSSRFLQSSSYQVAMGNNSEKVRYEWRLDQIEEVEEMREIGVNLLQKVSQLSVVVKKILALKKVYRVSFCHWALVSI